MLTFCATVSIAATVPSTVRVRFSAERSGTTRWRGSSAPAAASGSSGVYSM